MMRPHILLPLLFILIASPCFAKQEIPNSKQEIPNPKQEIPKPLKGVLTPQEIPNANPEMRSPPKTRGSAERVDLEERKAYYRTKLSKEGGCLPLTPPVDPPDLPEVPLSFMTELEMAYQEEDQHRVVYGQEAYDHYSLRGVNNYELVEGIVLTRPLLLAELIHYSILKDEALFIMTNADCSVTGEEECYRSKYCTAGTITDLSTELQELFGIVDMTGGSEFMGAVGILQFGPQFNYTAHQEVQTCRGLDCDVFETCMEKPDEDAVLLYTYYWSTKEWNMQNNKEQVPIAVEIYGNGKFDGHTTREVMMRIDFLDFRRDWIPSKFELEPPVDVYCMNKKSLISPPRVVTMFSYKSEHVTGFNVPVPDGENQTTAMHFTGMFGQQEWYDFEMRIARRDYLPFYIFGNARRFENYTMQIHDYDQGLAYHIRPRQRYCNIHRIENITSWGDVVVEEDGSVHIQSPWNFEDMDEPLQYNGQHWERGMEADVWVGMKKNPALNLSETYVWYFASPLTHEILGFKDGIPEIPTLDQVPIKLEKYLSIAEGLPHVLYNIYDYDSKRPTTHTHDVSVCYSDNHMRSLKFDMPANSLNKSLYLRENLKYGIVESLRTTAVVSPLRINRLEIRETKSALEVEFTLLEKVDAVSDVPGAQYESSMDKAASLIKKAIDNSQLVVIVRMGNNVAQLPTKSTIVTTLVAMPNTMKDVTRDDGKVKGTTNYTGYTAGAMAGLAFGMIFLGLIIGYAGLHFYGNK